MEVIRSCSWPEAHTCTTQGLAIISPHSACYAILMHMACIVLYDIHLSYLVNCMLSSASLQASIENSFFKFFMAMSHYFLRSMHGNKNSVRWGYLSWGQMCIMKCSERPFLVAYIMIVFFFKFYVYMYSIYAVHLCHFIIWCSVDMYFSLQRGDQDCM